MLSRVADTLYWMSRYLERADNTARLLDVNLHLLADFKDLNDARLVEHWEPIIQSTGDWDLFRKLYSVADSYSVTDFLTFNRSNPNSILSCYASARQNARMIRDQISTEMWEAINKTYLRILGANTSTVWHRGPYEFYQEIKDDSHLFQGLTDSTFVREEGYNFVHLGRYIERGDKTSRILDIKYHILLPRVEDVGGAVDTVQWTSVLRSCSGLEAYHRSYVASVSADRVAEFLVLSPVFPRSILFCVERVDRILHRLTNSELGRFSNEAERLAGRLYYDLTYTRVGEVMMQGLHEYLDYVQARINEVSDAIFDTFIGG